MRVLKFIVDKQIILPDPDCDFTGLVPGSKGYLRAEFRFSSDWANTVRVAQFTNNTGECTPKKLEDGRWCMVPDDAAEFRSFSISILGKSQNLYLTTNSTTVVQNGGRP